MDYVIVIIGWIAFVLLGFPVYCRVVDRLNTRSMERQEAFRRDFLSMLLGYEGKKSDDGKRQ